jgi:hypothetical protein
MAHIPHAGKGAICPLHRQDTSKVCHSCPWWSRVIGKDPQSEATLDEWRCAMALLPMLLIEGAQQTRQAAAAVETLRNEMVTGIVEAVGLAAESAGRLLDARHDHRR